MKRNCKTCNEIFEPVRSQVIIGLGYYCSRKCSRQQQPKDSVNVRLWKKIKKIDEDSCWLYTGSLSDQGYGKIYYNGKVQYAHRILFEVLNGKLKKGEVVMHTCDNPRCCNPNHLLAGTQKDNIKDMVNKGRNSTARGECHSNAKLTDKQVIEIRNKYTGKKGEKTALGKEYKVVTTTISDIVENRSRKFPYGN